jgi:hypothetical protein
MRDFIKDKHKQFTDKQLIKAFYIMNTTYFNKGEREEIKFSLLTKVLNGNFEFNQGNTLASFAESFLQYLELAMKDSTNINLPMDLFSGK